MSKSVVERVMHFKHDLLSKALTQCTQKQQEFFHHVYPKITEDNISSAIDLCERTIQKNLKDPSRLEEQVILPSPPPFSIMSYILEKSREDRVVLFDGECYRTIGLDELVKQPADGILYDLNRLPEIALTCMEDPKWINDYAVALVIQKLKDMIDAFTEVRT